MRTAIRKAGEAATCASALYKEMALSALRLVPGRRGSIWPALRAALGTRPGLTPL
jgi:hypothetical protein